MNPETVGRPRAERDLISLVLAAILCASVPAPATAQPVGRADAPVGQVIWAVPVSLPPAWSDPAETTGLLSPFIVLYALHDALVKPMPGKAMAPSLAESWSGSPDGLTYEFYRTAKH